MARPLTGVLLAMVLGSGCGLWMREAADYEHLAARLPPIAHDEAVVAESHPGMDVSSVVFQVDALPEEARRLVAALDHQVRARRAVGLLPSADGVVLIADRRDGPEATYADDWPRPLGTWVWPDWRRADDAFLVEDARWCEFLGPRHLLVRSASGRSILDVRDPSQRIELPPRFGAIRIDERGHWVAVGNEVEVGAIRGRSLVTERTLRPRPRQYNGSHGLLLVQSRYVVLCGDVGRECRSWYFDLAEESPVAHDLGQVRPWHVLWPGRASFCATKGDEVVRVTLAPDRPPESEALPLLDGECVMSISPSGRSLLVIRPYKSRSPTRSFELAGETHWIAPALPISHDWLGGQWLSWRQ